MSALTELITPSVEQIELWPIERVLPNPLNPRGDLIPESLDELAASLLEHGILTPLLAVPAGECVHLVAGHRRRAAAEMSGLRELPVILHRFTLVEQLEIMLVENLQRQDLTLLQEARGFQALIAEGLRKTDIARRLSVQPKRVQQGLELLRLDESVARSFDRRDLPAMLISDFARVSDHAEQRASHSSPSSAPSPLRSWPSTCANSRRPRSTSRSSHARSRHPTLARMKPSKR